VAFSHWERRVHRGRPRPFPNPSSGPWVATPTYADADDGGRMKVIEVTVHHIHGAPLRPEALLLMPLSALEATAPDPSLPLPPLQAPPPPEPTKKRRGRPPTYHPIHYKTVAEIYSKAILRGEPNPAGVVLDWFRELDPKRYGHVKPATVRQWIARARKDGLLPKIDRAAGEPQKPK
jgi:hypothetical protein